MAEIDTRLALFRTDRSHIMAVITEIEDLREQPGRRVAKPVFRDAERSHIVLPKAW